MVHTSYAYPARPLQTHKKLYLIGPHSSSGDAHS